MVDITIKSGTAWYHQDRALFAPFTAKNDTINDRSGVRVHSNFLVVLVLSIFGKITTVKDQRGKNIYLNRNSLIKWCKKREVVANPDNTQLIEAINRICKKHVSAVRIQASIRGHLVRKSYKQLLAAVRIQAWSRGHLVRKNYEKVIPVFLKLKALNMNHSKGFLQKANEEGYAKSLDTLMEKVAEVNVKTFFQQNLPQSDAEHYYERAVSHFLRNCINIEERDSVGKTHVHLAAQGGHVQAIRFLSKKGVEIDVKDLQGRTPLHLAAFFGQVGAINALLESGADIKARDGKGYTALHLAALNGQVDAFINLLESGADITVETLHVGSPIDLACSLKENDIIKALLAYYENKFREQKAEDPQVKEKAQEFIKKVKKWSEVRKRKEKMGVENDPWGEEQRLEDIRKSLDRLLKKVD